MEAEYSVIVVGAAVLIMPKTEEGRAYGDAVNSILYAQLVANKRVEKYPGIDWYDVYTEVLDNFWVRRVKGREDSRGEPGSAELLTDRAIDFLSNTDPGKKSAISELLDQCAGLSAAHPAIKLLRTHVQGMPNVQALPVPGSFPDARLMVMVASSPTVLSSVYLALNTRQPLSPNPVAEAFRARDVEDRVTLRYAQATLSQALYDHVRDDIALRVQDRLETNVAPLTLCRESHA
ncbi:hypothetical protein [Pseudomonas triticicola]|uniref:hypothetical protein n=1 Tax=Pseudomonas triticicola TaxID=2842345 RepID=UPI003EBCCE1A